LEVLGTGVRLAAQKFRPVRQTNLLSSPEVSTLVRAGLWLAVLGGGLWFLTQIQVTLTLFGLAWLIAYLTRPVVGLFEGKRLGPIRHCPRAVAVGAIYFWLCAGLFLLGSLTFPAVTGQFNRLLDLQNTLYHPQELAATLQSRGERLVELVPQKYRAHLLERLESSVGSTTSFVGHGLSEGLAYIATFFKQLAAGAAIFVSSLLISVYLLFIWESLYVSLIAACPVRYRPNFVELVAKMNQIFGGYLRATIITSGVNALGILAGLSLFALLSGRTCPYAYLISLIALLTYPIPLFGILATVISAAILGFVPESDASTGLWAAMVVFSISLTIDRTLQPKLMGDAIGVSPVFVIFAAAAGGEFLGGVWGMLVGIPLAAMTKAFLVWFHDLFLVDRGGHEYDRTAVDSPLPEIDLVVHQIDPEGIVPLPLVEPPSSLP
jgi:predicted PurR-regulated permease PerM